MKQGWEVKRLKDLLEVQNGYAFASSLFSASEGMPLIRIRDLKNGVNTKVNFTGEYNKDYIVQKGDFLIGMDGEFRCYEWAGDNALLNQRVCRLQNFEDSLLPKFLFYGVNKHLKDIEDVTSFTTVKHISSKKIKDIEFPIPPLEEQKQIVAKLDQCFEAIDKAKANAAKNLENAKELFQSKLNDIFSQKGEGWVEKKLGDISDVTYGFTDKSVGVGDFRYVRITDIDNNGELISTGKKYISPSKDGRKFILKDNDILMARTGATFAKLLLYKDIEPSIFASYLIKIDFTESIDNEFYWFYAKSNSYWDQANTLSTGSAQPHFNGKALKQVLFPYPVSKTEQSRLINEFKRFQSKTQSLESKYQQELNSLEELKKSILQKAFEGEL
jgi:type I restriction enzyme S subunit